jgi:hypothetical protein
MRTSSHINAAASCLSFGDKVEHQTFGLKMQGSLIWAAAKKSVQHRLFPKTPTFQHSIIKEYMSKHIGKSIVTGLPPPTARRRPSATSILLPQEPNTQTAANTN